MSNAANKTKRTKKSTRTEAQIRVDLAVARDAEHSAVDRCSNDRPASLARAWAAVERTNELFRELATIGVGPLA